MNITNCQLLLPCLRRFCLMKKFFPFKILEKLCFFNFFMLEFNIFSNKIPRKKHSHLSNGSRLTSQTVHFYSPATSFLFDEKFVSFSKFLQNFVFLTFSRLNLRYLIIKSQKINILISQMVHDEHRKLSTFIRPLTSSLFDEKCISFS